MRRVTLAAVVSAVALSMAAVVIMAKQDVHCDLFYDGQWNDVTAAEEVFAREPFGIVRGRADEVATAVPDSGTFILDNRTGKYNPRNPVSPLFGKVGENTPARVHIGTPHVGAATAESVAATSHVAPSVVSPTGEALLIGVWANPDPANAYTVPASMTAGAGTTDARTTMKSAYQFLTSSGPTGTRTATVGTAEEFTAASVLLHGKGLGVASLGGFSVVLDVGASAAGDWWVVASYFGWDDTEQTATPDFPSDNDGGGWILLADTGIDTWSDPQADFARMKVWAKRVKTTSTSHQLKVDNPTGDLDSIQSVFYRVTGVTGWFPRLHAEAGSFKPGREIKGPAWVNVGAFGPSMRLTQGEPPKDSALTRYIRDTNPLAWWPLEVGDQRATISTPSGLAGGSPLIAEPATFGSHALSGTVGGAAVGPPGSSAAVDLSGNGQLASDVPASSPTAAWRFEMGGIFTTPVGDFDGGEIFRISYATASTVFLSASTVAGEEAQLSFFGGPGASNRKPFILDDGAWHHIRADFTSVGGGASTGYEIAFDGVVTMSGTATDVPFSNPTRLVISSTGDLDAASHPVFWSGTLPAATAGYVAFTGHAKEKAGRRFLRLCREEDLTAAVVGDPDDTQPMGSQPAEPVAVLLADIGATDDALIGDAREFLGLRMRTGRSMAAQQPVLELDYGQFHIAPPLAPVVDDQGTRNDITVKRRGSGDEARAVQETGPRNVQSPQDDPQGVGRYRQTVDVNTATVDVLPNHAGWHRHKGTVDEIRWPQVTVDLLATPELATVVSAVDSGDLITIDNLPDDYQAHQARLLIVGYGETIHTHRRLVTFNCVPASTRDVGVYGTDTIVSRYDSAHSTLDIGVDADDTSLSVATEAGHALWITGSTGPTFPFDVRCAGIRLTVIAISGASSPQTFTVLRNVDGIDKALAAGEQIRLWKPARYGL